LSTAILKYAGFLRSWRRVLRIEVKVEQVLLTRLLAGQLSVVAHFHLAASQFSQQA
jgi:hypothetical protein